jgi:hypothetical protein
LEGVVAPHAEDIALAGTAQGHLDVPNTVDGVCGNPREWDMRRKCPFNHRHRQAWFAGELYFSRHMRGVHSRDIVSPSFRQIQSAVDEGMAVPRHIGGEDADLTIGDLAGRPRLLATNPARGFPLLEEARLVDHENGLIVGERLKGIVADDVAQILGIPPATPEDRLSSPWSGIARCFGTQPSCLALLGTQQAVDEQPSRNRNAFLREQSSDPHLHVSQRRRPQIKGLLNQRHRQAMTSESWKLMDSDYEAA